MSQSGVGMPTSDAVSVLEVTRLLKAGIRETLPGPLWVDGIVWDLGKVTKGGSRYFSLVQFEGEKIIATLAAVARQAQRAAINRKLRETGMSEALRQGTRLRARGRIDLYAARGRIEFAVADFDVASLRAERLLQRDLSLKAARAAGIADRNKALAVPSVPLKIGLVTSLESAAHHDVLRVFAQSGFAVGVHAESALVQGEAAPASIAAALGAVTEEQPDIVLLCRGGGSAMDLHAFDSEEVVRAVALCPIPVFVGVGHETDSPAVDVVAHTSFATPTAAAAGVVSILSDRKRHVERAASDLQRGVAAAVAASQQRLTSSAEQLTSGCSAIARVHHQRTRNALHALSESASACIGLHRRRCASSDDTLGSNIGEMTSRAHSRTAAAKEVLDALDPARLLKQGWAIVIASGRSVRSVGEVSSGSILEVRVSDGHMVCEVLSKTSLTPPADQTEAIPT